MARKRNLKRAVRKVTTTVYISLENDNWLRSTQEFNLSKFINAELTKKRLKADKSTIEKKEKEKEEK